MKRLLPLLTIVLLPLFSFRMLPAEWKIYTPENSSCSVTMPGEPKKIEKVVNSALGELKLYIFMYQPAQGKDDNLIYSVSYSDMPAEYIHSDSTAMLKTFFDNTRDGAIKNIQGKLLSETIIDHKGYPGREQRVDFKDGMAIIKFRYYLIKNRLYTMQVITASEKSFNTSINKFLDSFSLTGS